MRHQPARQPERPGIEGLASKKRHRTAFAVTFAAVSALSAGGMAGIAALTVPGTAAGHYLAPDRTATLSVSIAAPNSFKRTNLVANTGTVGAKLVDHNLKNAWGLAAGPTSPVWVSDNNSGFATVYTGGVNGSPVSLALTVPVPGGNPTGQVFNSDASAFKVAGTAAVFIVATDSIGSTQSPGEIAAWNGGAKFVVETSPKGGPGGKTPAGAVFKGLAIATTPKAGPELFAADVANARVDVFNSKFASVKTPGEFSDPKIPAGYAPFGIQDLGNKIYVSYGKQNKSKTDVVTGAGLGFVDVYSVDGKLISHLISGGRTSPLDAPWGLAIAPAGFGPFGGDLLVGNLGNGWINAFNATTGKFAGTLDGPTGYPVTVNGLWGIRPGNSAFGGAGSLVFGGGPANYNNGVLGILTPAG
jgi:uncharacterized protein (TIGR03118 family)